MDAESGLPKVVTEVFPHRTTVFGIEVWADTTFDETQFTHMARILASYLDGDKDGCSDDPVLTKSKAFDIQCIL